MTSVKHVHKKYASTSKLASDWKNIYVISAFAFTDALQFAFFVWTFWPYVQQLDPSISASFIGLIMAVSGVGEAVAAPILGYWTNRTGVVIPPLVASVVMSIVGNVIYMCLNNVPVPLRKCGLLVSRFLNGAGSGNRGTFFAYIAAASEPTDRARAMALSGGGALIGLNVGPAVQMLFTWIGSDGVDVGFMRISMYTAPAILAIVINLACIVLLLVFLKDGLDRFTASDSDSVSTYSIAAAEDSDLERNSVKTVRMDILAAVVCMWTRAARMLITANVESIGSPFSQVMFGLDNKQVLNYNAMMQGAVGVLTTVMFLVYVFTPYSKWISERLNCLGAMVALLFFHLLTFSWPFLSGQLPDCAKCRARGYRIVRVVSRAVPFCLRHMKYSQECLTSIRTTFSSFGPRGTWLIEIGLISLCIVTWCAVYRRLMPAAEIKERNIVLGAQGAENPICRKDSTSTEISRVSDPAKLVSP
ncbi:hypothetical protein Y032_0012g1678 [Ancylostoma ceylanicum]|uniref:Major facilitator superfamily (MFS) profile domain-containing protein n=1 Tax=Ancylostoma ceylanicum TaxID=53326 RepID=A0A016VDJ4_9BILA|nr:hypothetical protein Y032_0012g1678 [Ancylostoma ceylanicum]